MLFCVFLRILRKTEMISKTTLLKTLLNWSRMQTELSCWTASGAVLSILSYHHPIQRQKIARWELHYTSIKTFVDITTCKLNTHHHDQFSSTKNQLPTEEKDKSQISQTAHLCNWRFHKAWKKGCFIIESLHQELKCSNEGSICSVYPLIRPLSAPPSSLTSRLHYVGLICQELSLRCVFCEVVYNRASLQL